MTLSDEAGRIFDFLKSRKISYQLASNSPGMQEMLIDLAKFCHGGDTCVMLDKNGKVDETLTHMREGRREVWLRIQEHLNLNTEQLYALYTGNKFTPGEL